MTVAGDSQRPTVAVELGSIKNLVRRHADRAKLDTVAGEEGCDSGAMDTEPPGQVFDSHACSVGVDQPCRGGSIQARHVQPRARRDLQSSFRKRNISNIAEALCD